MPIKIQAGFDFLTASAHGTQQTSSMEQQY